MLPYVKLPLWSVNAAIRYRPAHAAPGRTLILYELADAAVLSSPAYLARLDDPTPWSRRIMPMLRGFARGGGPVVAAHGAGQGGCVLAWRLDAVPDPAALPAALVREDRVCALRLMVVDQAGSGLPTAEKALRGGDAPFAALLLLEGTDEAALRQAAARHRDALGPIGDGAAYGTVFAMRA